MEANLEWEFSKYPSFKFIQKPLNPPGVYVYHESLNSKFDLAN